MASKIKSINPVDFTKGTPTRDSIIENASSAPVKSFDSYTANRLAKALHPAVQHLKVAEIVERGADVKSYTLVPDEENGTKELAYFAAGQYLSITVKIGEIDVTRPYSISSSPKESLEGKYVLTIKRVGDGLVSQFILDNWSVGTCFDASAPLGTFTYEPLRDASTVIGLAGGSGITPFHSLAKAIVDGDEDCSLVLLYGSKNLDEALFMDDFKALEAASDKIKVVNVLSDSEAEGCEKGFITADLIKKYAPEGEYSIFLCGPQAMYNFADKEIEKLSLRRKFVRHELFGEYHNPEKNDDYKAPATETVKLTVKICDEVKVIDASIHDTMLVSMEKNGILAPARCRSGVCGFCHSRLVSGDVYVPKSVDGRRVADLQFGYVHPCCTFPLGDCTIDVPPYKA